MGEHSLLNDIIFKIVFGQHVETLRPLLNAILGLSGSERIREVTVLNPDLDRDYVTQRGAILDVRARDDRNVTYNIEVQVRPQSDYIKRSAYYLCRLYGGQAPRGHKLGTLERCVSISLVDFEIFPDFRGVHSIYRLIETSRHHELTDDLEIHYLELSKLRKAAAVLDTPLERWLHALLYAQVYEEGSTPLPEPLQQEEGIPMALDLMKKAYSEDKVRELLRLYEKARMDVESELDASLQRGRQEGKIEGRIEGKLEGKLEGRIEGKLEGKLEGKIEGKIEVARALLAQGMPEAAVASATQLGAEEIARLAAESRQG